MGCFLMITRDGVFQWELETFRFKVADPSYTICGPICNREVRVSALQSAVIMFWL